jgi:hypothetical protein
LGGILKFGCQLSSFGVYRGNYNINDMTVFEH